MQASSSRLPASEPSVVQKSHKPCSSPFDCHLLGVLNDRAYSYSMCSPSEYAHLLNPQQVTIACLQPLRARSETCSCCRGSVGVQHVLPGVAIQWLLQTFLVQRMTHKPNGSRHNKQRVEVADGHHLVSFLCGVVWCGVVWHGLGRQLNTVHFPTCSIEAPGRPTTPRAPCLPPPFQPRRTLPVAHLLGEGT